MPSPARVRSVPIPPGGLAAGQLAGQHYGDAFAVALPEGPGARALAEAVCTSPPAWIGALMAVRHALVAPLGLVATRGGITRAAAAANGSGARIGVFPLLAEAPDEVVLGLDDRHLDFRVSVRVLVEAGVRTGVIATAVRFHGALGRAYWAPVGPAHRVIVPAMLRRAARRLGDAA